MDNDNQITKEEINSIYTQLADAMLEGLEANTITLEESQISSQFILDTLDTLTTREQILSFLENISNRWSPYKSVFVMLKEQKLKQQNNIKIEEARRKIETLATTS